MPREPEALLSVQNLKTYFPQDEGTVQAVDGVSFDLYAGRTLGIVGESGCGKSITARSILRIIDRPGRIMEGQILFRRQKANEWYSRGGDDRSGTARRQRARDARHSGCGNRPGVSGAYVVIQSRCIRWGTSSSKPSSCINR